MENTPIVQFRNATVDDLDAINAIEAVCFPPNEAASRDTLLRRLKTFPHHFWLLETDGQLAGFINGMVTDNETIVDEMFGHVELHDDKGQWQCVFGLAVSPDFRKNGFAGQLIHHMIAKAKEENRAGVTLTCKEYLIPYYERFGFTDSGVSKSMHGGEVWHDLVFRIR